SVDCVVTSPPYWKQRDYGTATQLGLEESPQQYVASLVLALREVRRVMKPTATLWLNIGDTHAGSRCGPQGKTGLRSDRSFTAPQMEKLCDLPLKSLIGIPWRVALAMQDDGWILRSNIIWAKPNPRCESVKDRPTKSHEHVFLFVKQGSYYFDQDAVREPHTMKPQRRHVPHKASQPDGLMPAQTYSGCGVRSEPDVDGHPLGRNIRDVWKINTQAFPGAHFAVMPPRLVEPCIKAGCPEGGLVLDPFMGAGTVGLVADRLRRRWVGLELSAEYARMARDRIRDDCPLFAGVGA
nr:site-specific DNA-methyltransferase [Armatimonadota bacterium]